jgi:hypothetical protein
MLIMSDTHWTDNKAGAAKRVGHYLATEVGEGGTFNKATLRQIVENTEQVDRRMRDLRKVGWVIRTYKDKASLKPNELFLEKIGDEVWTDGYKWPTEGLTAAVRRRVFSRDGSFCLVCGIQFGTEYPDRPGVIARGTIGHIRPKAHGGTDDLSNLRPECQLCNETARNLTDAPVDVPLLKARIKELGREDKKGLLGWMVAGSRTYSERERLWAQYVQLPTPIREEIKAELVDQL